MTYSLPSTDQDLCNSHEASLRTNDTIKMIGDFWTLRIIDAMSQSELRFCELERALPTINPVTLTNRLKRMEDDGLIMRRVEIQDKQSVSYGLTTKGRSALPILEAIKTFVINNN